MDARVQGSGSFLSEVQLKGFSKPSATSDHLSHK